MMSQISNFGSTNGNNAPAGVVVLHRQGRDWRLVILSREDRDGRFRLESHTTIPTADSSALRRAIDDVPEGYATIRVLPGGTVVCRSFQVPPMEAAVLQEALELQAESVLPSSIEPHRRASTVLPWTQQMPDENEAVAIGWPGHAPDDLDLSERSIRFAPTMSCLIEILTRSGGEGIACYLDRDDGAFDLVMHRFGRTAVRTVRLDGTTDGWMDQLDRIVLETAISLSIDVGEVAEWRERLRDHAATYRQMPLVDEDTRERLTAQLAGSLQDRGLEWWKKYGMALMAGVGSLGSRKSLFMLQADPPAERRQPILELLHWIDRPSRALAVLLIAVLAFTFIPFGAAWGRYQLIQSRVGDIDQAKKDAVEARRLAQFYDELRSRRWPMTKLMADISGSAPLDVQIEEITIDSESRDVRLKGTSPNSDDVISFQDNLSQMGIFSSPRVGRQEWKSGHIEFELSFRVTDPVRPVERSVTTGLAEYLYGDDASRVREGEFESGSVASGSSLGRGGGNTFRRPSSAASRSGNRSSNTSSAPSDEDDLFGSAGESDELFGSLPTTSSSSNTAGSVPPVLSDEQISAMSGDEANAAAKSRASRLYDPALDDATKTRLRDEMNRLVNHWRQQRAADRESSGG